MSINYRPPASSGGMDGTSPTFNGNSELGYGSLSASVENQLSGPQDLSAARQFFQPPSGAEAALMPNLSTGVEGTALTAKAAIAVPGIMPGADTAAMSAAAHAGLGAVAGAGEISPLVQLIMKLPGGMGVASSFFEWLQNLFMPSVSLTDIFNPVQWAHLGAQIKANIAGLGSHSTGLLPSEHLPISLSLLPQNAHIFHQLSMTHGLTDLRTSIQGLGNNLPNNGLSQISMQENLNVSGTLDLKKPQFEFGSSSSLRSTQFLRTEGMLSGPSVNGNFSASQLSGSQRLFSDRIASAQAMNSAQGMTITSNTVVPSSSVSQLNVGASAFGQQVGQLPANYQVSDGVVSGPSMSDNVGYQLSGQGPAPVESASNLSPSGAVSEQLGEQQLLASNSVGAPTYQPAMSGYYHGAEAGMDTGSSPSVSDTASPSSGLKGLKAEALSILKKSNPANAASHSKQVVDHVAPQNHAQGGTSVPSKPPAQAAAKPELIKQPQPQKAAMEEQASISSNDNQFGLEQQAQPASADGAQNYTVQSGDNLWDIASKQLGDGSRWTELYKLNSDAIGSNPALIHGGLELKMPGAEVAQGPDAGQYTVQSGDNLWDIAEKNLGDGSRWGEIYQANASVVGDNPSLIFSGQTLQMPATPVVGQALSGVDPNSLSMANPMTNPIIQQPQALAQTDFVPEPVQTVSQVPVVKELPMGPGAAGAATLDSSQVAADNSVVSASLAPDLSFLNTKQGS